MHLTIELASFAPSDAPSENTFRGVQELLSYFNIPAEFVAERLHSVTHSFGWHQETTTEYGTTHLVQEESVLSHILLQSAGSIPCAKILNSPMTGTHIPVSRILVMTHLGRLRAKPTGLGGNPAIS